MAYGAEGIHWTRNGDGTISRTDLGFEEYMPWDRGMSSNYMDLVPALDTLGVTYKADFLKEQSQAVPTAIIGFVFDQGPVVSEIAALATVYAEYNFRVSTGAGSPEIMEQYRQKLFDNGMQKLIDEVNRQLKEYYANK
jgi:putative aldouronate transport system substrate-binding protein